MPSRSKNFVTYRIRSKKTRKNFELISRLDYGAKMACDFWNYFLDPKAITVAYIDTYTSRSDTIAKAYSPKKIGRKLTGEIEFNTEYLRDNELEETAAILVHEIGHTLGIGWDKWNQLFNRESGKFRKRAIARLPKLEKMLVETDGVDGDGTAFVHWDEDTFGSEIMTGQSYTGESEHVLPVTIEIMELLGHAVKRPLKRKTEILSLFNRIEKADIKFSDQQKEEARKIKYPCKKKRYAEIEIVKRVY